MKQLLFGGTFDPPHWGHMGLLKNAIEAAQPDKVVVIPAGLPPHKQATHAPATLRVAMCACFYALFPDVSIWDYEVNQKGKSYTVETVRAFSRAYPLDEVMLCIGGDMLLSFTDWYCYEELLARVVLVVQNRRENEELLRKAADRLRKAGGRILFTQGKVPPISSTMIRAGLAAGEDVWQLVPPPVEKVILQNGLYRGED